jgi:hypothetical protein
MPLSVAPDARVMLFAASACITACLLFSVAPALLASKQSFQALSEIRAKRWRLGKSLVVAQMAISVLLLVAAGLFGRTMINLVQPLVQSGNGLALYPGVGEQLQSLPLLQQIVHSRPGQARRSIQ